MASYDYLESYLKNGLNNNDPIFTSLFGNAQRRIGMSTDRNVRNILQQNAQSGFRGVGANQINDAYRTESDALLNVNDQIMSKELQQKNFYISQLLGLEQMKSQETDFWDVLGGVLGTGVGFFTGGLGSGLASSLFKGK
jgi:hypothetical protein